MNQNLWSCFLLLFLAAAASAAEGSGGRARVQPAFEDAVSHRDGGVRVRGAEGSRHWEAEGIAPSIISPT